MNTAAAPENWEGQIVDGRFPLLKWLSGTPRSDVFRTQLPGKEPAAIKLISAEGEAAQQLVSRWQMAAALTHPHLLKVLHSGQCKLGNTALAYVVMEFAEEDLSQVLPARALSADEAREMMTPLLDTVSYLHSRGLVHGRIKPSNIMAVADQLRLSSDSVHSVSEPKEAGLAPTAFDAPEVAKGIASRASDIWSLGVTVARCLSPGKQARENYNPVEQGIAQTIPEPFRRIARECLRPDPKARCTLADIRESLRVAVVSAAPVQTTSGRRSPALGKWAIIAAVVLLAVIFVARWAGRGKPEAPAQTTAQPSVTAPVAQPASPAAVPSQAPPAPKATAPHAMQTAATAGAVVEKVVPDIPASARNTIQGTVRVSVRVGVNPAGGVADATLASPGPSKYFANKALEAARRWKFKPAELNGQPIASSWMLRFQFGRESTGVVPTELPAGSR